MEPIRPIRVLIVDDSPLTRAMFTRVLSEDEEIEVVGGAKDPYEARELIIAHRPAVIILDIEMPRMDGITFLKKLKAHYPVPVIVCSGATDANGQIAIQAIEAGAIDVVAKPRVGGREALRQLGEDLADKIRAAAIAMPMTPTIPASASAATLSSQRAGIDPRRYFVAIGASTGGTEAIAQLLRCVPADFPPVAIVQHMPEGFTRSFADRLNQLSAMSVSEAVEGDVMVPGKAVVARGGTQMSVVAKGGKTSIRYGSTEPVNRHCPSVEVLFDSVALQLPDSSVGIILTGMGGDGARGLLRMREAGAILTLGQTARSCVVYGMPKVAAEIGAVEQTAIPADMPAIVLRALHLHQHRAHGSAVAPAR